MSKCSGINVLHSLIPLSEYLVALGLNRFLLVENQVLFLLVVVPSESSGKSKRERPYRTTQTLALFTAHLMRGQQRKSVNGGAFCFRSGDRYFPFLVYFLFYLLGLLCLGSKL